MRALIFALALTFGLISQAFAGGGLLDQALQNKELSYTIEHTLNDLSMTRRNFTNLNSDQDLYTFATERLAKNQALLAVFKDVFAKKFRIFLESIDPCEPSTTADIISICSIWSDADIISSIMGKNS